MNKVFRTIEVSGSYKDIGNAIGEELKVIIRGEIDQQRQQVPGYRNLLEISRRYYDFTGQMFPHLIEELNAIAAAAGVSALEYFFMNNREVYDPAEQYDSPDSVQPDHCTIVVSFSDSGAVVGHNEDWDISALDRLYILKASVNGTTFMGVNYSATVPGPAAMMNNHGLVQCINDLYQISQFGVPKNFIARAVLECHSLEEAELLIRNTQKASGFNHVLVQGNQALNIEIAGNRIATQKVTGEPFVHTNHYLSSELAGLEKFHTVSSERRYTRAKKLAVSGMNAPAMQALLSDTYDAEYPICRENDTIASLVFEPAKLQINICKGHPCAGTYRTYTV